MDSPEVARSPIDRLADRSVRPIAAAYRWGFVAAAVGLSAGLRFLLDPYLPPGVPFVTFFPAIAITAVVVGTPSGAVVAVLSLLIAWYAFLPPLYSFKLGPGTALSVALFALVAATELTLVHMMRRALRRLALAEAAARELAESRRLMFHELQHRVSNNLAVVGSLLQLQRREVKDPEAKRALEQSAARVNVVSRLNRLLHDPQAQEVEFGAFLRGMVPDATAAAGAGDRVAVSVATESVVLPAQKAVPLGLVAAELLSNALEHGFPGGRRGNVQVSLERRQGHHALLTIHDDGVGLPEGFDLDQARSLGLQIARQFAGQLGATLSIASDGGVTSRLEVPLD